MSRLGRSQPVQPVAIHGAFVPAVVPNAIAPAAITATSTVTFVPGNLQALRAVTPAGVTATSGMTATVTAARAVKPAAVNATSTVSGSLVRLVAIRPSPVSATSTVTAPLIVRHVITPPTINATSLVTATVTKQGGVVLGRWIAPTVGTQIAKTIDRARTR